MQDVAIAEAAYATLGDGLDKARKAVAAGDLTAGLVHYAALRAQFPEDSQSYQRAAFALVEASRFDESDALLETAMERFPAEPGLAIDYAWVAHRRRAVAIAVGRWERVRRLFPAHPIGFIGASITLREAGQLDAAQAILGEAEVRFANEPSLAVEQAWMAIASGDLNEAIFRWAQVRERTPDAWLGYTGGSTALRNAGRFAEADTLLAEAMDRFPAEAAPAFEHARMAMTRRDWPEALRRWANVDLRFPGRLEIYTGQAQALREMGRLGDAEGALRRATDLFPGQPEALIDLAWAVTHQHRHDEAIALWADVRARFPDHVGGFTGGAVALGNAQRIAEAIALLEQGEARFPDSPGPPTERGWLAMNQRDYPAAEQVFAGVRERFPGQAAAALGQARALAALRRLDEAEALLRDAVVRFPGFALLANDLAELVALRQSVSPASEPEASPPANEVVSRPVVATVVRSGPIKIAVTGYHLANQIAQIFSRIAPLRNKVRVERLDVGMSADAIQGRLPPRWLESADFYFEESRVGSALVKDSLRSVLPPDCVVRTFSTSGCHSLWPFRGRDERLVPEPPVYNGGRYSHTDPIAASLAGLSLTDDALFDAYMELTDAAPLDLDLLLSNDIAQWKTDDRACDVQIAGFIESNFRERQLFTTPHERAMPIVRDIVRQLAERSGLADRVGTEALTEGLDNLLNGWRGSHQGLPVHPRVARHFGLQWWSADMRYRMLGNDFTFREFILRYIRWSPWLP